MLEKLNKITEKVIGCAIEVHKNLGPGLLELIYEKALCYEFDIHDIKYKNQLTIPNLDKPEYQIANCKYQISDFKYPVTSICSVLNKYLLLQNFRCIFARI